MLLSGLLLLVWSCKNTSSSGPQMDMKTTVIPTDKDKAVTYVKSEFTIEGMTCAVGCANTIQKKLAAMEGVHAAEVNFESKNAMVEYDPARVKPEDIVQTVTTVGDGETYKVWNMKAGTDSGKDHNCNSDAAKPSCCMAAKKTE